MKEQGATSTTMEEQLAGRTASRILRKPSSKPSRLFCPTLFCPTLHSPWPSRRSQECRAARQQLHERVGETRFEPRHNAHWRRTAGGRAAGGVGRTAAGLRAGGGRVVGWWVNVCLVPLITRSANFHDTNFVERRDKGLPSYTTNTILTAQHHTVKPKINLFSHLSESDRCEILVNFRRAPFRTWV